MKTVAIICEYNPFHAGHAYHIKKSKEISEADNVVCLMSGNFVQRGLPAITDKYLRARSAIKAGADLVVELPVFSSCASAEIFASNAINILNKMNIAEFISFGAESNLEELFQVSYIYFKNKEVIDKKISSYLRQGFSFSNAYLTALSDFTDKNIVFNSNNILALEYIKALINSKSEIVPLAIERVGQSYNDKEYEQNKILSASTIRNILYSSNNIKKDISNIYKDIELFNFDLYYSIVRYLFLKSDDLSDINGYNYDLYFYLKRNLNDIFKTNFSHSKNFSSSQINRFLLSIFLDIKRGDIYKEKTYEYINILSTNDKGLKILNKISNSSDLHIITSYKGAKRLSADGKKDFYSMIKYDSLYYDILSNDDQKAYNNHMIKKSV